MVDDATDDAEGSGRERSHSPLGSFQEFRRWCIARGLQCLPARPTTVAAFLREKFSAAGGTRTLAALRAIRRTHAQSGADDPTDSAEVFGVFTRATTSTAAGTPEDLGIGSAEAIVTDDANAASERDLLRACASLARRLRGER